jgi:G6PDH family F420-dependent oxidoreductase
MLEEAVEVLRALFTGETLEHRGTHFEVENARLFDPPVAPLPIVVSGFGPDAAALAGRIGDGYWGNAPDRELLQAFTQGGSPDRPRYAQLNVCWNESEEEARRIVHEVWPNAGISGQLSQDLPTWTHFEQAAETVRPEDATKSVPCGPDIAEAVLQSVKEYVDAGYDHLYFHQIGGAQEPFLQYWERELLAALA